MLVMLTYSPIVPCWGSWKLPPWPRELNPGNAAGLLDLSQSDGQSTLRDETLTLLRRFVIGRGSQTAGEQAAPYIGIIWRKTNEGGDGKF